MRTFILSSCALFLISTLSIAQEKGQLAAADSLLRAGQLLEAVNAYRSILGQEPANQNASYNLACSYALLNMRDSAFHFLDISLAQDTSVRALNDPDFVLLLEDERWAEIEHRQVEKVEAKYGKYPKPELSKELWRMQLKDQAYYYHMDVAEKQLGPRNPLTTALWQLKKDINAQNEQRLEEIIAEHGWPKKSEVKGSAAQAAFLVIQHADLETQEKYLPMMREAVKQGNASPGSLALLEDRVALRQGKRQIYGSQIGRDPETGEHYVLPLTDPENVNERRKEVGLGPIEDYISNWNMTWNVEKHKKRTEQIESEKKE